MEKKATLNVFRGDAKEGGLKSYEVETYPGMVVLDAIHDIQAKQEPTLAVRWNCKAGRCGSCGAEVNGKPKLMCMTRMSHFAEGEPITVKPMRAFPVIKDLVTNRGAFDRIIQRGGFVSVNTGGAQDANNIPVPKPNAELAMDAAACIGCGACVAACKNASAMLFVASKVSHLSLLPQGAPERKTRVLRMVEQMDKEGFGSCTNYFECEAACPKQISVGFIARMNREYLKANLTERE